MLDDRINRELARFDVDPVRGFLPPEDPLDQLPAPWTAWDRLGLDLSALIAPLRLQHHTFHSVICREFCREFRRASF